MKTRRTGVERHADRQRRDRNHYDSTLGDRCRRDAVLLRECRGRHGGCAFRRHGANDAPRLRIGRTGKRGSTRPTRSERQMERTTRSDRAGGGRPLRTYARPMIAVAAIVTMVWVAPSAAGATTTPWIERYDGPGSGDDSADAVAVSPDGSTVFVTGLSQNRTCPTQCLDAYDYATVAYDESSGARVWTKRYDGPAHDADLAESIVVSPNGSRVFVTGESQGTTSGFDYATIAYDASTGAQLWVKRYNGPGNGDDAATSLAVSPDSARVFVTGWSNGTTSGTDYATIAYDENTGVRVWTKRYNGPGDAGDLAVQLSVAGDGTEVFVTGTSEGTSTGHDYATVAYRASTGEVRWVARYNGAANLNETATSLAVSPDGSRVIVTGESVGVGTGDDYATVAYDAVTGAKLWSRRYNPPANGDDVAFSIAISPDGSAVYVTGESGSPTVDDYATVAYETVTGTMLGQSATTAQGTSSMWRAV